MKNVKFSSRGGYVCALVDVLSAESGGAAVWSHELIVRVDADHVLHEAKGEVMGDPGLAVHKRLETGMERKRAVLGALRTAAKVLASIFGGPHGKVEGVVECLEVGDKYLGAGPVKVEGNKVKGASVACSEEVLHPGHARGRISACWRAQLISLMRQRLKVLFPELRSILRANIRLARLVGFVETERNVGVARLDETGEVADLLWPPQHRGGLETELLGIFGNVRAPRVDWADLCGLELGEIGSVAIGPGDTHLTSPGRTASITWGGDGRSAGRFAGGLGGGFWGGFRCGFRSGRGCLGLVGALWGAFHGAISLDETVMTSIEVTSDVVWVDGECVGSW